MQGNRANTEIRERPDGSISPPPRGLGGEFPEAENREFSGYEQGSRISDSALAPCLLKPRRTYTRAATIASWHRSCERAWTEVVFKLQS
jgi:hypothetical protein